MGSTVVAAAIADISQQRIRFQERKKKEQVAKVVTLEKMIEKRVQQELSKNSTTSHEAKKDAFPGTIVIQRTDIQKQERVCHFNNDCFVTYRVYAFLHYCIVVSSFCNNRLM